MKNNSAGWKWLFCVGILTVLTSPCLQAADLTKSTPETTLSLDKVRSFLFVYRYRNDNTSPHYAQDAKELIGKMYGGSVVVAMVEQGSDSVTITAIETIRDTVVEKWMLFVVEAPALQKRAAQLREGDRVFLAARLASIGENTSVIFKDVKFLGWEKTDQTDKE